LNRLGVDHGCDGRTDRQTDSRTVGQREPPIALARSPDPR